MKTVRRTAMTPDPKVQPRAGLRRMALRRKLGILTPFLLLIWHATVARAEEHATKTDDTCHKGSFSSETYRYSITLPEGMRCCHDPAPNPVHGCAVPLPGAHGVRLWVDGSYNTLDYSTPDDALNAIVGRELVAGTTFTVVRHERVRLGTIDAVRLTLRLIRQGDAEARVEDRVIAIASRGGGRDEVVYTVGFQGPASAKYETLFSQIVSSWKAEVPTTH